MDRSEQCWKIRPGPCAVHGDGPRHPSVIATTGGVADTGGCSVRRIEKLDPRTLAGCCDDIHRYYAEGFEAAVAECEKHQQQRFALTDEVVRLTTAVAVRDAELAQLRTELARKTDLSAVYGYELGERQNLRDVEAWLKAQRNSHEPCSGDWTTLDDLLDEFRLHMHTGTPLDQHACDGPHCCADGAL